MSTDAKLAVLLHADVVGSTRLVQQHEQLAHERMQDCFKRLQRNIREYGGVTHEVRGDALVAEFQRASDALLASLAFQQANIDLNDTFADGLRPRVRIGIALGEVVIANKTVTGAGIVLAQRLEQLAEHDGICVQGAIKDAAPIRFPFIFTDLGHHELKGFDESTNVYSVDLEADKELPAPTRRNRVLSSLALSKSIVGVALALILAVGVFSIFKPPSKPEKLPSSNVLSHNKPTVAVLPFRNLSDSADQQYFSDGLTEDIITDLSRVSGLFVISRNSSFAYRDESADRKQIASELGVEHLVDGSIRRQGKRVRITAQLIRAGSGEQIWADRYDREIVDVFSLQDELTRTIVKSLTVRLSDQESDLFSDRDSANFDAYDVLLRANELLARFSPEENVQAKELYEKAIALDPTYARAYANLAYAYSLDLSFGWVPEIERDRVIQAGRAAANEGLRLDPDNPRVLFAVGNMIAVSNVEWTEAVQHFQKSVELEPSYADGHVMLAVSHTFLGNLDKASASISKAKVLNPRYSNIYLWIEGRILYLQGKYEEAVSGLELAAQRNPGFHRIRLTLAATYAQLGRTEDAHWEAEEVRTLDPTYSLSTDTVLAGFTSERLRDLYADGLRKAGFLD